MAYWTGHITSEKLSHYKIENVSAAEQHRIEAHILVCDVCNEEAQKFFEPNLLGEDQTQLPKEEWVLVTLDGLT